MKETVAHDWWQQGWAEGWAEGVVKGELQGYRSYLQHSLVRRFGPLPEAVLQRIEAVTSKGRLLAAIDNMNTLKCLDDLDLG